MSYINLIKDFWHRQQENPLRPADIALYLYLAEVCNSRSWPATFALSNKHLQLALDFSAKTLLIARDHLIELGFIAVKNGVRNTAAPEYTIAFVAEHHEDFMCKNSPTTGVRKESEGNQQGSRKESEGNQQGSRKESEGNQEGSRKESEGNQQGSRKESEGNQQGIRKESEGATYIKTKDYRQKENIERESTHEVDVYESIFQDYFKMPDRRATIEGYCATFGADLETVQAAGREIVAEWRASEHKLADRADAFRYMTQLLRIKLQNKRNENRINQYAATKEKYGNAKTGFSGPRGGATLRGRITPACGLQRRDPAGKA